MSDYLGRHSNTCDYCGGLGKLDDYICPQCKGKGFVVEDLDLPIKGVRPGDILLIKNYFDPMGWIISYFTKYPYHHVALVINKDTLVELKATGKKITYLKNYLNRFFYRCKLLRIKKVDKCKLHQVVEMAKNCVIKYNYSSSLINFLFVKFKLRKKMPRLTCSGFIAYFLLHAKFYFCFHNYRYVTPKCIGTSRKCLDVTEELYQ